MANICIVLHVCSSLIKFLREKVNGKVKVMPSLKKVFQIGRNSSNAFGCMKNPNLTLIQRKLKCSYRRNQ